MRLLLIDDHKMFIDGLAVNLQSIPEVDSVTIKNSAESALKHLEQGHIFHLIMLDLNMPDINGFQFMDTLEDRGFYFPIAILSGSENPSDFVKLRDYGICGYISKSSSIEEFNTALSDISKGHRVIPKEFALYFDKNYQLDTQKKSDDTPILPRRKMEILKYLSDGMTNRDIAEKLFVAKSTVDDHVKEIYRRLEVSNRAECVNKSKSLGIL